MHGRERTGLSGGLPAVYVCVWKLNGLRACSSAAFETPAPVIADCGLREKLELDGVSMLLGDM